MRKGDSAARSATSGIYRSRVGRRAVCSRVVLRVVFVLAAGFALALPLDDDEKLTTTK